MNHLNGGASPMCLEGIQLEIVLLSFAILMAGASVSKILLVCKHMGLAVYSPRTFFYHQSKFLFPTIFIHWEAYQSKLIESIRTMAETVWCGDSSFILWGIQPSMGLIQCFTLPL